jgi:hypothetical protein
MSSPDSVLTSLRSLSKLLSLSKRRKTNQKRKGNDYVLSIRLMLALGVQTGWLGILIVWIPTCLIADILER